MGLAPAQRLADTLTAEAMQALQDTGLPAPRLAPLRALADMVVQSDSFRARVEGVIYGATLVSITPVGDDTYETTLSLDATVVDDIRNLYLQQLASARVR